MGWYTSANSANTPGRSAARRPASGIVQTNTGSSANAPASTAAIASRSEAALGRTVAEIVVTVLAAPVDVGDLTPEPA
jgi:hypothetical protein